MKEIIEKKVKNIIRNRYSIGGEFHEDGRSGLCITYEQLEQTEKEIVEIILAQQTAFRDIVVSKYEIEKYDNMVCSKCKDVIRERTSHHSEDGFSQCCGKKLERVQGEEKAYSYKNEILDDVLLSLTEEV